MWGVVADTRTDALSVAPAPEIYLPFWQNRAFSKHLVVGSRLKEIAVRKAIGAQQHDILRSVLGEGGRMILVGVVVGGVVAAAIGRALETLLFGVPTADVISIGAAAIGFGVIALVACLFPARRAARTDLVSALYQE